MTSLGNSLFSELAPKFSGVLSGPNGLVYLDAMERVEVLEIIDRVLRRLLASEWIEEERRSDDRRQGGLRAGKPRPTLRQVAVLWSSIVPELAIYCTGLTAFKPAFRAKAACRLSLVTISRAPSCRAQKSCVNPRGCMGLFPDTDFFRFPKKTRHRLAFAENPTSTTSAGGLFFGGVLQEAPIVCPG